MRRHGAARAHNFGVYFTEGSTGVLDRIDRIFDPVFCTYMPMYI